MVEKNDKGFSLVEFVIVITIIAILVGIVGTQVIPYIERAKKAKDIQIVSAYCTSAMTAYTASAEGLSETEIYTIFVKKTDTGWTVNAEDSAGNENLILENNFYDASGVTAKNPSFRSNEGKKITQITMICRNKRPMVQLSVIGPDNAKEFEVKAQ